MNAEVGKIGEQFVACWLKHKNWKILSHRWHCRWGELDLVAHDPRNNILSFIEVKTRSKRNWDQDGLLAINFAKQQKICRSASFFLMSHPHLASSLCRFDVALVGHNYIQKQDQANPLPLSPSIILGKPALYQGHQLILKQYIESAFDFLD